MNEMKVAVARCLRRFQFELVKERPAICKLTGVLTTENGMYLQLKERRQQQNGMYLKPKERKQQQQQQQQQQNGM